MILCKRTKAKEDVNMNSELRELFDDYEKACYLPTKPYSVQKLPANHIEDENKSVKWNKEFVESNNKRYLETLSEKQRNRSLAMNQAQDQIVNYIRRELKTSVIAAKRVLEYAIQEGHSSGIHEVYCITSELIDIIKFCKEDK